MSMAAHLLAARARKRAAGKQKEPLSLQPAAKRRRVAAALAGRHSVGEAARDLVAHQPGCNGASAANVGAAEDSGDEHDVEAEGGQASYEALLRSLQASRESDGPESGSGSGSSTDSEGEHAPGGATEGVRKGSKAKSTPVRERERQAACSTEPSRSRAARARAQLGGAATGSLGAKRWADQLHGARPVAAAAQARRRDGEADDAGAAWGQRMERHFGREVRKEEAEAAGSSALTERGAVGVRRDAWPHATWLASGPPLSAASPTLEECGVQERLIRRWREVRAEDGAAAARRGSGGAASAHAARHVQGSDAPGGAGTAKSDFASAQQCELFNVLQSYKDVLFTCRPYPVSADAPDDLLDAVLLHCLAHVGASAAAIKRNSERLKAGNSGTDGASEALRDQGFTRPKVLLLLPLRSMALRAALRLAALAQRETRADSIQGKQRLAEEFGGDEGEPEAGQRGRGCAAPDKPAEHAALFAGNADDHFRFGVKITRGAVRLFAEFYQADVIIASPLGLATALSAAAAEGVGGADFLSSLEIAVVDRADVMLMQNWAHVTTVFEALNRLPEAQRGADIMRVRPAYLAGRARNLRQTILLASFASAELNALARSCANVAGRARVQQTCAGVLGGVLPRVRQLFERFRAPSAAGDADARFAHFRRLVWPRMQDSGTSGQLVFIPSYFDYVRVRALVKTAGAEFAALSEYAQPREAARARSMFADGRLRLALTTERAHFFLRIRTRGVKARLLIDLGFGGKSPTACDAVRQELLIYQLPEHAHFYAELVNLLESAGPSAAAPTVTVLFSRFDAARLERAVGGARAKRMLGGDASTFVLC